MLQLGQSVQWSVRGAHLLHQLFLLDLAMSLLSFQFAAALAMELVAEISECFFRSHRSSPVIDVLDVDGRFVMFLLRECLSRAGVTAPVSARPSPLPVVLLVVSALVLDVVILTLLSFFLCGL